MPQKNPYKQADDMSQKALDELEGRIKEEYGKAFNDAEKLAFEYFRDFNGRDSEMRKQVDAGKISDQQYKNWRLTQISRGNKYNAMMTKIADRLNKATSVAKAYINDTTPGIYSLNRNFTGYLVEQYSGDIDFTLTDEQTVKRLIKDDPDLMPYYPEEKAVARGIDQEWGRRVIKNSVTQGIILGESIPKIADRVSATVTSMSQASAIRAARTAATGAQNGGRLAGMEAAEEKGINVQKQWLATLDDRTRESHQALDGIVVKTDEKFPNGCMYPGDPGGPPEEVYNCRCTLIANLAGINSTGGHRRARAENGKNEVIENMTYSEWAGWKEENQVHLTYRPSEAETAAEKPHIDREELRELMEETISGYSEEMQEKLLDQLSGSPIELQEIFCQFSESLKRPRQWDNTTKSNIPAGKAFYRRSEGRVYLRMHEVEAGDSCHLPGQTHFHEYGHNIDNLMGIALTGDDGIYISDWWTNEDGKTFGEIISDDALSDIKKVYEERLYGSKSWDRSKSFESQVKDVLDEYANENGNTSRYKEMMSDYNAISKSIKDNPKLIKNDQMSTNAFDIWDKFMKDNKDDLIDAHMHMGRNGSKAIDQWVLATRREDDGSLNMSSYVFGDISDLFSQTAIEIGGTGWNAPLGVGHSVSYWNNPDNLGREGFAEFTSAFTSNPESLEQLKKHLPNAYNAYLEIIKEGANNFE